jgi:hypothetical protein
MFMVFSFAVRGSAESVAVPAGAGTVPHYGAVADRTATRALQTCPQEARRKRREWRSSEGCVCQRTDVGHRPSQDLLHRQERDASLSRAVPAGKPFPTGAASPIR